MMIPPRLKSSASEQGFSLVEVVLAVAVVAIALLPMISLLPAEMTNYESSIARTKAAQAVSEIATCIQLANPVAAPGTVTYTAMAPFDITGSPTIKWSPGGSLQKFGPIYLDENGIPTTISSDYRMVAMITVTPQASVGQSFAPGSAYIYVAWPGQGTAPTWVGNLASYPGAQGHEEVTIPINPSSP